MPIVEKKADVTHNAVYVYSYTWSMRNYTLIKEHVAPIANAPYIMKSPKFILNNQEWEMELCFSFESTAVTLNIERIRFTLTDGKGINGNCISDSISFATISILNESNEKFNTNSLVLTNAKENGIWPFTNYIEDKLLENNSNRLLKNNTLNLIFELTEISSKGNDINDNSKVEKSIFRNDDHANEKRRNNMEKMYLEGRYSDVKLVTADGRELPAHKNILSFVPFFDNMFQHEMKEQVTSVIEIKDVRYEVLKEMLRFIYTGKVENAGPIACELLIVADKYLMDDLKIECSKYLCKSMSTENILYILQLANKYDLAELKTRATEFVKINFDAITKSEADFMSCLEMIKDDSSEIPDLSVFKRFMDEPLNS